MSASHVTLAVELPDLEDVYPILETDSPAGRQAGFLAFVSEQFDSGLEEEMAVEDIALEGGWFVVDFQCSNDLCNEITHAVFEGLSERDGRKMTALEYNSRIGVYTIMVPGYDEAEYVDECFEDFDGLMHELEDIMDRREQLLHVLELMENEPVRSALSEYLDEEDEANDAADVATETPVEDEVAEVVPEEPEPVASDPMAALKRAMADGDEERINELMAQVQENSGTE
jgi:hypothetical protein